MPSSTPRYLVPLCLIGMGVISAACDDGGAAAPSNVPFGDSETVVVQGGDRTVTATPSGSECLDAGTSECVRPQETCGEGASTTVVLDDNGDVVRVVCYPDPDAVQVIDTEDDNIKDVMPGAIILLDNRADGDDVDGNVEPEADDVTIAGYGPDVSVINGNIKLIGDNGVVTGVRVRGNLNVEGDGATILDCVVEGNLHIKDEGALVQNCVIFGDTQTDDHTAQLYDNHTQKNWNINERVECENNFGFTDTNENFILEPEEIGELLPCPN